LATAEDVTFGQAIVGHGGRAVLASDAVVTWHQRAGVGATVRMYRAYGRGDGLSGHPLLIGRNVVRSAAYGLGAWALLRGGRAERAAAVAGAAVYLSMPIARARRRRAGAAAWALLPAASAMKDLPKAWGCIEGVLRRGARKLGA
jgi:hypothetical protein